MRRLPDCTAVILVAVTCLAAGALAQTQEPGVQIESPTSGEVLEGPNVELKMQVQGVQLTPRQSSNSAYVLLRLDDAPPVRSYSNVFTFQDVSPGNHLVRVELRRGDGNAFDPPIRAQVRFAMRSRQR